MPEWQSLLVAVRKLLMPMLEEAYQEGSWADSVPNVTNPFGCGDSGERIAQNVSALLTEVPAAKYRKVGR